LLVLLSGFRSAVTLLGVVCCRRYYAKIRPSLKEKSGSFLFYLQPANLSAYKEPCA
jgi:hypothetical protein